MLFPVLHCRQEQTFTRAWSGLFGFWGVGRCNEAREIEFKSNKEGGSRVICDGGCPSTSQAGRMGGVGSMRVGDTSSSLSSKSVRH